MIPTALENIVIPPCSRLLGWQLLDVRPKDGWIRVGFEGRAEFCNSAGFVQGGILSTMLDDTMGAAMFIMTEFRLFPASISLNVSFLAPARPGPFFGEAEVLQLGKSIAFVTGKLTSAEGICVATATQNSRLVEATMATPVERGTQRGG
jgi:uncharacterized protein (TIGR00369 family)